MKKYWQDLSRKLAVRSQREQWVILAITLLFIFMIWHYLFASPLRQGNRQRGVQVRDFKTKTQRVRVQLHDFKKALATPPTAALLQQRDQLQKQAAEVQQKVQPFLNKTVTPANLPIALKVLVDQGKSLSLNDLELIPEKIPETPAAPNANTAPAGAPTSAATTQPPASPNAATTTTPTAPTPPATGNTPTPVAQPAADNTVLPNLATNAGFANQFYTVTFHGNYFATVQYLKNLENADWWVFIDELDYQVTQYPLAAVKLKVYLLAKKGN